MERLNLRRATSATILAIGGLGISLGIGPVFLAGAVEAKVAEPGIVFGNQKEINQQIVGLNIAAFMGVELMGAALIAGSAQVAARKEEAF